MFPLSPLSPDRFDLLDNRPTMNAVVTTGNGGYDKLVYRRVPIPVPGPGEALVQVLAAGMNNTEINTRIGWYSPSFTTSTEATASAQAQQATAKSDGGWSAPTPFPFIQGTDCCGRVTAAGDGTDPSLIGKRVLIRPCMRPMGFGSMENVWMGSDFDGAFAEFVTVPASEVFPIECDWSDAELGSLPCAYGTTENMLHRAKVGAGDHVLVTGASGGVGSAAVQLAKRRGASVTAVAASAKHAEVAALGADRLLDRGDDPLAHLGERSVDVIVDNVGGPGFADRLKLLRRGGRCVTSGAIGGPVVPLDMRDLYLNDITMIGCTAWDEPVFPNLISYVERGEIRPLIARTFALKDIAEAQKLFLDKRHTGKFVLIVPGPDSQR